MLLWLALLGCTAHPVQDSTDTAASASPVDADGDGFSPPEDCDDGDPSTYPGAPETCNGADDDCDNEVDEGVKSTWYRDRDGDGWGDDALITLACERPDQHVDRGGDCDDVDPNNFPGNEEVCDGADNDCDAEIDEGFEVRDWYPDGDGDGYGDESAAAVSACGPPSGYLEDGTDCDDADAEAYPGASERCDAKDDDCDGVVDEGDVCPCGVEHYRGKTYMFCSVASDWPSAQAVCRAYGYELASIADASENSWLDRTAATYHPGYWWVGGNDRATEGVWTWSDGTPWSYTDWCGGEPNNSHGMECVPSREEDCLVMAWSAGGCWNDYPCNCSASEGEPYQYVCESP